MTGRVAPCCARTGRYRSKWPTSHVSNDPDGGGMVGKSSPELGTYQEAADVLRCTRGTIGNYVAAGRLTKFAIGPGRLVRVDLNEVRALAQPVAPMSAA